MARENVLPRRGPPDEERRHHEEAKAPDIPFRWREGPTSPPA